MEDVVDIWTTIVLDHSGSSWIVLDHPGSSWIILDCPGPSWNVLDPPGLYWIVLDHPGSTWIILDHPGLSWIVLKHPGSSCIILDCPGLYWIVLDHPGSTWIILDHPGLSWIVLEHPGLSSIVLDHPQCYESYFITQLDWLIQSWIFYYLLELNSWSGTVGVGLLSGSSQGGVIYRIRQSLNNLEVVPSIETDFLWIISRGRHLSNKTNVGLFRGGAIYRIK